MEKLIVSVSYWMGLICTLTAIGLRVLNMFGILSITVAPQGSTLSFMSFYKGALLFFVIAIATTSYSSMRGGKS